MIDMSFRLELSQYFSSKLTVRLLECLHRTQEPRPDSRGVKHLNGFIAQSPL